MERVDGGVVPLVQVANVDPIPVSVVGGEGGGLTDEQLRASALPVSIVGASVTLSVNDLDGVDVSDRAGRLLGHVIVDSMPVGASALTDTELRASPLAVTGTFYPATQPVSGTFWQSVQPVSGPLTDAQIRAAALPVSGTLTVNVGLTDSQLRATPVPVSGSFYQATQPVSIASMPSTPVTGTFWQATQPVSGPLTDTQLRAVAVPVSGTFWQSTQPVSIAAAVSVTGTFWQATQPISAAALPLPSGAAAETTLAAASAKLPATLGQKAMSAALAVSVASDQSAIPITPPTLTKSTQGATGVSTQDLKDAGRTSVSITCTGVVGVVSETILTVIATSDLVAAGGATTYTVPVGKRFRATGLIAVWRNPTAVAGGVTIRVRAAPSGTASASSPLVATAHASSALATIGAGASSFVPFEEGFEFPAGASICLTQAAITTAAGVEAQLVGYLY